MAKHSKNITGLCPYTKTEDGGNVVSCDKLSKCESCGWNPAVSRARAAKVREERRLMEEEEKDTWLLGPGSLDTEVGECRQAHVI